MTHVQLKGDAASWWAQARGRYPRSAVPRPGAVLVDQANWVPGRVGRAEPVIDVSGRNDWSRVKVWWAPIHDMGKTVYPAYGFILPTG